MEFFSVLMLIVLLVIMLNQNSKTSDHLQKLEDELKLLRRQLLNFTSEKKDTTETKKEIPKPAEEVKPYTSIFSVADKSPEKDTPQPADEHKKEGGETIAGNQPVQPVVPPVEEKVTIEPARQIHQQVPAPTFFERHPDMERFIGENLVSKIGIAILVLAIGFFVKYAIDQNWIGPVARVAIGILCGSILIALAHRFRNSYRGFSSVLAGGGIAVFYFTITLAFQQFHLFSQAVAFVIMIVITIFAIILSLLYDKQELAIIALIGGFLAPMLVSTGSGNYKVLFSYLIILNTGILIIAYNKAWRLLNFLSFVFTIAMFGSWLLFVSPVEIYSTYKNAFLFATVFYLLFFIINIAHNIKEKKKFIASDFGILLANTSLYFAAGIYCLHNMDAGSFRGLYSASMGIFNLGASYFLFQNQKTDRNILYLLIGITLTFVSITAPIQLHGNNITLFWASEAVLLYWFFTKSRISIIPYAVSLVWALMLISLLMDWFQLYGVQDKVLAIIINRAFITSLFAGLATYTLFFMRHKEDETIKPLATFVPGKNTFKIVALVILFLTGALEINHQFVSHYPSTGINMLYLVLFNTAFVIVVVSIYENRKTTRPEWITIAIILAICSALYSASLSLVYEIQAGMLTEHANHIHFTAHWVAALLAGFILFRFIRLLLQNKSSGNANLSLFTWIFCTLAVIFLSVELHLIVNEVFYAANNPLDEIQRIYIKTGLPILWGLCSFVFMWLGMHYKFRTLRIISLSLFTLTLLKLFIFDIRNIPAGGKIAAFFCLGVLLLVVSFMYQRLKKIIIDEEKVD